ncbi:MAG: protein translocase subunit SecD [Ignavibacteriae bacterium]|nr:protein translocase subunit SecD [Ignavibacteriota bacterium]
MRKNRNKLIFIAIAVALGLYFLYPTYQDYQMMNSMKGLRGEDSLQFVEQHEDDIREYRARRIKLGLDLQGGMRVVLEVNVVKLLEDLAKNKDDVYAQIIQGVRDEAKRSEESAVILLRRKFEERKIRLSRYYGNLRDTDDEITAFLEDESKKAIDRAMEIVRNRVDQYGVSEPSIQKLGGSRIIVELPGVSKEAEVRQLLQGTALLEFKLLKDADVTYKVMEAIDKALVAAGVGDTLTADIARADTDTAAIPTPEGELSPEEFAEKHPFFAIALVDPQRSPGEALVAEENKEKIRRILEREDIKRLIPQDMRFQWSAKPRVVSEGRKYYTLYPVRAGAELTGGVIVNARATIDPNYNQPIVTMEMNSEGSREWARITGANINKRIAIVLDNAVFSAPVVRNKITGGNSQIEGMENLDEARLLEIVLKAGALPAPVDIVEQRSVGPSLGEDSIRSGLLSSGLATLLTLIFMILYYRTGGGVADLALVFCLLFLLAILAGFHGTLTLPGIAGIILTLAVAVDANVLIYERIREELGTGKTLRAAIDAGYEKAFSAIFDSNLTTFITGVILYQFGTGPVQGFALTLMIGIAASMFSAIFITRVIFEILTEKYGPAISFG